jgi:chemotaxis protein MotB
VSTGQTKSTESEPMKDPAALGRLVTATERARVAQEVRNLKKAKAELEKALAAAGLRGGATFRFDQRGLVVSVATDKVLFDSGSAALRPQGRAILDALDGVLLRLPNQLSVDGHTNRLAIRSAAFASNWELSTARATGVLRYMATGGRIPVLRMSATGYADTRPLLPYTDRRALSANRRVEIVVLARVDSSAGRAVSELGNSPDPAEPLPGPVPSTDRTGTPHRTATTQRRDTCHGHQDRGRAHRGPTPRPAARRRRS